MRVPKCNMEMFLAVVAAVESRTKLEAAKKLNLTISALEKRLRSASNLLHAPLFYPYGNRLLPTDDALTFYPIAQRTIEDALLAEQSTEAHVLLKSNHLLIGHSSQLVPRLLEMIRGLTIPGNTDARIEHRPGLTPAIVKGVLDGTLHAGFGYLPLTAPELLIWTVLDEPLAVCLPATHPLATHSVIYAQDLQGQPVIALGREQFPRLHEEIEEYLSSVGIQMTVVADTLTPAETLVSVQQQVGLCFMTRSAGGSHKGVIVRPLWNQALRRRSGFFVREDNRSPLLLELSGIVLDRAGQLSRR